MHHLPRVNKTCVTENSLEKVSRVAVVLCLRSAASSPGKTLVVIGHTGLFRFDVYRNPTLCRVLDGDHAHYAEVLLKFPSRKELSPANVNRDNRLTSYPYCLVL